MPDPIFEDPRLAELYDLFDDDRSDLAMYVDLVEELGARSVLDVGCGTGSLAVLLAARGVEVVGVDPAAASLEVARGKPGSDGVRWSCGDATTLPPLQVDLALMTGNVAQVFLTDDDWAATLAGVGSALRPEGWLVFETREPAAQAWREWTPDQTLARRVIPSGGEVETWCELTDVAPPLVSFRWTLRFPDRSEATSDSTLRFRTREEVSRSLVQAGFTVADVRDAPDRPGRELVFLARRDRMGP